MSDSTLDTTSIPVQERYAHILEAFDSLAAGESLRLIVDHSPADLCHELHEQRPDEKTITWKQTGINRWEAIITRAGAAPCCCGPEQ